MSDDGSLNKKMAYVTALLSLSWGRGPGVRGELKTER